MCACPSCSSLLLLLWQHAAEVVLLVQGKDTSKVAGLSCRSGRVVLAGDRNYNPVPITMILKEHEGDKGATVSPLLLPSACAAHR